jgi:hypothetical protein
MSAARRGDALVPIAASGAGRQTITKSSGVNWGSTGVMLETIIGPGALGGAATVCGSASRTYASSAGTLAPVPSESHDKSLPL